MAQQPPKEKVYFGCLPKAEVGKFIENLKKSLAEGKKTDDKKKFELEIKGTDSDPKGVSFETFSVTKDLFPNYVDKSKDYIGKALSVLSVSINAKDEAGVKNLEELFKKFVEPFVKELPFFKKHLENFEIHFRTNGNKVSVDLVSVKGEFLEPLLNLGINVSDFHNFKASFKSEFRPDEFFTAPLEELSLKALQLLLSVKGNSTGGRYLLTALIEALKGVKLENAKFQKKLENHVDKLNALNAFLSFCFEFQFDAKELCGAGLEASKVRGLDVNSFLGMARTFVEALVENKVKPLLTQYALVDAAKATDIDEITVSLTFPKHENGVAHVVKLPGFSKAFCDKFLK